MYWLLTIDTSTVITCLVFCCGAPYSILRQDLISIFFLDKRFSCAKRDNRESADLNFKGDRRVWDGETIKKLQGSSAMYVVVEDEVHYTGYVL